MTTIKHTVSFRTKLSAVKGCGLALLTAGLLAVSGCAVDSASEELPVRERMELPEAANASDATRLELGIVRWDVVKVDALGAIVVEGKDGQGATVSRVEVRKTADGLSMAVDSEILTLDSQGDVLAGGLS